MRSDTPSDSDFMRGFNRNGGGGTSSLIRSREVQLRPNRAKLKRFTRGRGPDSPRFNIPDMKLKSSLIAVLTILIGLSATGCNLFKKNKKPKENPAIASEVEEGFRQRWVDRRTGELVGTGTDATTARSKAEAEFRERYPYIKEKK